MKNKNYCFWACVFAAYLLFIAFFSFLYPYTLDEYSGIASLIKEGGALKAYIATYIKHTPKIGSLFSAVLLTCGKWSFVLLNPFVQLGIVLGMFYFIFARRPDFKSRADIYPFGLLCLLSVFAVPAPDNTLFWIGGAASYSWPVFIFLLFMCALRAQFAGKSFIKNNFYALCLVFILSLCLGLSNENNAPMALIIAAGAAGFYLYKRQRPPLWLITAFCGILIGAVLLFSAPGNYQRLGNPFNIWIKTVSLWQKLFIHISNINDFAAALLLTPLFAAALCAARAATGFKAALKNENFLLSVFCLGVSAALAGVLFMAPTQGSLRVFYSAGIWGIMAFVFALKLWGARAVKFVFYAVLAAAVVVLPLFVLPYINLHRLYAQRLAGLKAGGNTYISGIYILKGPTANLTINYYDAAFAPAPLAQVEKLKAGLIKAGDSNTIGFITPVI